MPIICPYSADECMEVTFGGIVGNTFHSSCTMQPSFGTSKVILSSLKTRGCSGPKQAFPGLVVILDGLEAIKNALICQDACICIIVNFVGTEFKRVLWITFFFI